MLVQSLLNVCWTHFLLHFKAALLLWLVTAAVAGNQSCGRATAEALLEERGCFLISDLLSFHLIQRYLCSPGSSTWPQTPAVSG